MVKFLKYCVVVLGAGLVAFVAWKDLTPGHFQMVRCCGDVRYITTDEYKQLTSGRGCIASVCFPKWQDAALLILAKLDLNK